MTRYKGKALVATLAAGALKLASSRQNVFSFSFTYSNSCFCISTDHLLNQVGRICSLASFSLLKFLLFYVPY